MDADIRDHLLIIYSVIIRHLRKYRNIMGQYISHLKTQTKSVIQLGGVSYNIINVISIYIQVIRLIKMCLNETIIQSG